MSSVYFQKLHEETVEGLLHLISTNSPWSRKVCSIRTHINSRPDNICHEHDLSRIMREVIKRRKGQVDDVLLVAAAITGHLGFF